MRPKYLVLNSGGILKKILEFKLDQEKQNLGDISFEVVYEQEIPKYEVGKYIIYRMFYPEASESGADAQAERVRS
jgi:hypothetical protein